MSTKDAIRKVLKRYPELPAHYIARVAGKSEKSKGGHANANMATSLKEMTDEGIIHCYSPTNDKGLNVSKHYSYSIEAPGYKDRNKRPERLLQSVTQADTEIGVRADPRFEFFSFSDFLAQPDALPRKLLDLVDSGGNPHRVDLNDGYFQHDGYPFRVYSKPEDDHWNYIDEIDRNTEQLTTTTKSQAVHRKTVELMWDQYHEFFARELYKTHYGFKNCKLRFFTVDETNMHSAMRLWENKYGKSPDILFATTKDWIKEVSYPRDAEIGETFRQKYLRVGYPDWYMNK